MIIKKFNYQELSRNEFGGKRHYVLPDGSKVPSVTTILDQTQSEEKKRILQEWKRAVGQDRAKTITTEAAARGTRMHKYLELYIKEGKFPDPGTNPFAQQSNQMAKIICEKGLKNVDEFWGNEVSLYYPEIYAGTTDCVGIWKNKPAIIDFKQTNKPKTEKQIEDYFAQLCAYADAHNKVYGSNIKTGVILMCSQDFQYQEWVIEGDDFDYWSDRWWQRTEQYYRLMISDK
ncbi:MAG: hypothetical protein N2235_01490 [Fischerella sp.]|nr:hypothetical protein [Fischerella sp.]